MSLPKPYYEHDGQIIYLGDCLDILPELPKVDLVLTDPPYGINAVKHDGTVGGTSKDVKRWAGQINHHYAPVYGDDKPIDPSPILAMSRDQVIWGGNYIADKLRASRCWFVWYKRINGQSNNMADCELAWTSFDIPSRVFQHLWMGMLRDSEIQVHNHPTQKPLELMKWCLGFAPNAQTILDPFMGSGTTLRAAKDLRRKAIGIEIEEKYAEIAARRLEQEVIDFPYDEKQRTSVSLSVLEKVASQEPALQAPELFDLPSPLPPKKQRPKAV